MAVEQRTSNGKHPGLGDAAIAPADDIRSRALAKRLLQLVDEQADPARSEAGIPPDTEGADP